MAQQGVLLDQDQFCCSVCLDLLKEPVTIPCGHSYCRSCIEGCWDQDVLKGVYSCPQCRETFTPRPTLRKNNMLAEVVDKLKKTGLQAAPPPALCYAGPGDVACDFCTGTRKQKALMSCLVCLASYCETHLQPHYEFPALKKHKLVKATAQLQEKICSHHDKLLEVYCRTDQQCICLMCTMDEHKGHDTVSAAAARTEKQRQLGMSQQKVQQRFQEREKELKELQQAVESFKSAKNLGVILDNTLSFSTNIKAVTRSCRFMLYNIRRVRPCLTQEAAQVLIQALVISRLDYCNSLLAGLPACAIKPLQLIQNASARLVFNFPKFSHVTPLLRSLHWLLVEARIRYKTMVLAYGAVRGTAPPYLQALIRPYTQTRALRSSTSGLLASLPLRKYSSRSAQSKLFAALAPQWWNKLPHDASALHRQQWRTVIRSLLS
ncbi:uncharacterized protein ACWYII_042538 isoform 2-T2 [Salvelinus alpinus]